MAESGGGGHRRTKLCLHVHSFEDFGSRSNKHEVATPKYNDGWRNWFLIGDDDISNISGGGDARGGGGGEGPIIYPIQRMRSFDFPWFTTSVCIDSIVYLFGGVHFWNSVEDPLNMYSRDLWYIDTAADDDDDDDDGGDDDNDASSSIANGVGGWIRGPPMISRRKSPCAVVVDRKIYVFGGVQKTQRGRPQEPATPEPWAEVFDTQSQTWSELKVPDKISKLKLTWGTLLNMDLVAEEGNHKLNKFMLLYNPMDLGSLLYYDLIKDKWGVLDKNFGIWDPDHLVVSAGGVGGTTSSSLFLFVIKKPWKSLDVYALHGYDIRRRKLFSVKGLFDGEQVAPRLENFKFVGIPKLHIISLEGGRLCVFWASSLKYPGPLCVRYTEFTVTKDDDDDSILVAKANPTRLLFLDDACDLIDSLTLSFLPINSMASSSSSMLPRCKYEVFLSFRGADTRKNFNDHLYTALETRFHTFRDDDGLWRGEDIASELEKAIRQSKLSIIVFSKDYASSRLCLDELVNIMECKKNAGHMVFPVFYHVNPSDVRNQTGTFAEAFARHKTHFEAEPNRVEKWRTALREVADLAGMSLQDGSEAQFVQKIIKQIERKLNCTMLSAGLHLIGTDYRVNDINSWLHESSDIVIGVICGMGGIGKTTIAKIAYNMNFNKFEGGSFLANIKEASEQPNGLVCLEKKLLSDILKGKMIKISNVDEGIMRIKKALCRKRFLIILDDVDNLHQLEAILGRRWDWCFPGSKVIITTRNESLLKDYEACKMFKIMELNEDESLQLLSWHAFGQGHPVEGYMAHANSIVQHCGGLPLALKVLGSSLNRKSVDVWESATQKLKAILDKKILEILKISYDSLNEDNAQNLFLDIACFFVGRDRNYTITILDGCDFYTNSEIQNLIDRCLITIDNEDKFQMHRLLQDMGREIVRQESPKNPGERSRLWDHKEVFNVLKRKTGTKKIESLILNFPVLEENMPEKTISGVKNRKRRTFEGDAFARMSRLRLLSLNYVQLTGGYENFSDTIRWLCWNGFPLKSIPTNFSLDNVVALDMRRSCLTHLWNESKLLLKLKILDLSGSRGLIEISNFSRLPNLERLILKDCSSLVEVHESIGDLKRLVFLNLKGCKSLRKLPQNIGMLRSLEELNLSGCPKLELLEELLKSESQAD